MTSRKSIHSKGYNNKYSNMDYQNPAPSDYQQSNNEALNCSTQSSVFNSSEFGSSADEENEAFPIYENYIPDPTVIRSDNPKNPEILKRCSISELEPQSYNQPETQPDDTFLKNLIKIVPILAAAILIVYFTQTPSVQECKFGELKQGSTNIDESVWEHLSVGINNVIKETPNKPVVFLFLIKNTSAESELIKNIADTTASCFDTTGKPKEMNDILTSAQTIDDHGHAIEKYREITKQASVVLISDLNKIPAKSARSLHFICDTVQPIKSKIVIFLSLMVPNIKGSPIEIAHRTLSDLWKNEIRPDELDALTTRLMDQVLPLYQ